MAAQEAGPPGDFYAGAIALFAVIVFAKFVAHQRSEMQNGLLTFAHWACVLLSAAGVAASLWVLGFDDHPALNEYTTRHVVLVFAIVTMLILAVDVAWRGSRSRGSTSHREPEGAGRNEAPPPGK